MVLTLAKIAGADDKMPSVIKLLGELQITINPTDAMHLCVREID